MIKLATQRRYAVSVNYVQNKLAAEEIINKIKETEGHAQTFGANIPSDRCVTLEYLLLLGSNETTRRDC